jgi:hypothetical protein
MRRVTQIKGVSGTTLADLFAERRSNETEIVLTDGIGLYNEPGDFTWDSLSPSEVANGGLRVFDTGLTATSSGIEYHHIVVRSPNGHERKAWTKWRDGRKPQRVGASAPSDSEAEKRRLEEERRQREDAERVASQRREEERQLLEQRRQEEAEREEATRAALAADVWADASTGLVWARRDSGPSDLDWNQAKTYCSNLTLGGSSRWRLPSIAELETLYDPSSGTDCHIRPPLHLTGCSVWSSTMLDRARGSPGWGTTMPCAWYFNFRKGKGNWRTLGPDLFLRTRALCVRNPGG